MDKVLKRRLSHIRQTLSIGVDRTNDGVEVRPYQEPHLTRELFINNLPTYLSSQTFSNIKLPTLKVLCESIITFSYNLPG